MFYEANLEEKIMNLEENISTISPILGTNMYFIHLMAGEEVHTKLMELTTSVGIKEFIVVSSIGSFKNVLFHTMKEGASIPVREDDLNIHEMKGPFEVLSLEGLRIQNAKSPHFHVILGASDGSVVGGHLRKAFVYTILLVTVTPISV